MDEDAIALKNVGKDFKEFSLDTVNFAVPKGYITGLVGENGAGKTTLLNLIMQEMPTDRGDIFIDDVQLKYRDPKLLQDIYIIFDEPCLNEDMYIRDYEKVLKGIYQRWDSEKYYKLVKQMNLPQKKKNQDFF